MPKTRNKIGQFVSLKSLEQNKDFSFQKIYKKVILIFMALFFLVLASPWITLLWKSKNIQLILGAIVKFCNEHFISEDEIKQKSKMF